MKYCIVVEPNTVDPKLATATLFDLLGDPSIWMDNHEVKFFAHEDKGIAEWAEEINDIAKPVSVIEDFAALDDSWIVLGPTVEEYVKDATAAGAKYLALDDGLVELAIEEEPEVPIVPDVEDAKVEEKVEEPEKAEEVLPEVPAIPKRRQSRAKKPVVEEAKPEFEEAVAEALEVAKPEEKPLTVESVREASRKVEAEVKSVSWEEQPYEQGYADGLADSSRIDAAKPLEPVQDFVAVFQAQSTVREHLISIVKIQMDNADDDTLWEIVNMLRK